MRGPSGASLRSSGPNGAAPHSGSGAMSQSNPNTANTIAREAPAHVAGTNTFGKEMATFKGAGELGAKGHGGM